MSTHHLTPVSCRVGYGLLAVAAAVLLGAGPVGAQSSSGPQYPIGAKPFERMMILQEYLRRQAAAPRPTAPVPRQTRPDIPSGAPMDRTFTWYAPPEGYEVILAATPLAPRYVTEVAPDGRTRIVRVEGPIVMRPVRYVRRPENK